MSNKVISIPDSVKAKTSGQEVLAEGVRQLQERLEAEKTEQAAQELVLDGTNQVSFPGFPYKFEAANKKIIVSIDIFKSGYECKVCKGKRRVSTQCSCEAEGHPGLKYDAFKLSETIQDMKGTQAEKNNAYAARKELPCSDCKGDYISKRANNICEACKGLGAILVLPETSKSLPTSGVVVSIGRCVRMSQTDIRYTKYGFKLGDRVLFGPYAGSMIPTKAGILFKILDANQIWAVVEGANDLGQFDFVLQDELKA